MPPSSVSPFRRVLTLAAATGLTACADSATAPVAPIASGPSVSQSPATLAPQSTFLERRAIRARLAQEIPGYAGMYVDASGTTNVLVARSTTRPTITASAARAKVRTVLGGRLTGSAVAAGGIAASRALLTDAAPVAVKDAEFDALQLDDWHDQARSLLNVKGVVMSGIAERDNRLVIGVEPGSAARVQRQVYLQLEKLRIPRSAVTFRQMNGVHQLATLREIAPRKTGGIEISFRDSVAGYLCSLGFNARVGATTDNYFVTASHCTANQGGVEGTRYFQARPSDSTFIGVEVADPAYGEAGGYCPAGRRCRFSDAAMARYAPEVDVAFGTLARTTFSLTRIGSLIFNPTQPRFTIVGESPYPLEGEILSKVGRTTGWTTGSVLLSCVDVNVSDSNVTEICQDVAEFGVRGGDSGSPVFQRIGTSNSAALYGILWGGGGLLLEDGSVLDISIFSAMEQIRLELGAIRTF